MVSLGGSENSRYGELEGSMHRQVCVKVNALVDAGVAELVEVLNSIEGVLTLDSCEGDAEHRAHVYFVFGSDAHVLTEFVDRIGSSIRGSGVWDYTASLEWFGSNDRPRALLSVPRERVADVASALRQLRP